MLSSATTTLLALCASTAFAVRPIEVRGADFINPTTGNRFQLLGIAYQPGGQSGYTPGVVDPLSDPEVCLRDAALMQRLGVNAIRAYNLDPYLNHDGCASIFNAVGIYMLLDVNSPLAGESINRGDPYSSYYTAYLNRTFAVVEAFKDYPNTLAFFSANEVINNVETGKDNPPIIRAVTRDLKEYVKNHASRPIPVGYSAADVRDNLLDSWNYLQCSLPGESDNMSRGDFFSLNSYSWCGNSNFDTSGYDDLVRDFGNTSLPLFFSEYGCNEPYPRIFTEVSSLYGPQMTPVFSGGLIYEYTQETSNYGIVQINSDGSINLLSDFNSLQGQFNSLNITALQGLKSTNATDTAPKCASSLIKTSLFNKNFTIPAQPPGAPELIRAGMANPPKGKIIPVTKTSVSQVVKDVQGNVITGLTIKVLKDDESNSPSGQSPTTSGSTPSGTSSAPSAPTTSKPSAASGLKVSLVAIITGLTFAWGVLI